MNWSKASIKYILKAYFGGCFGCLGALSATAALTLVFALTLGPQVLGVLRGIQLPSILIPSGPGEVPPSSGPSPVIGEDCYKTIDAWVSKSDLGPPATTFSGTDGVFPVVKNPTDCGPVNAKLLDQNDKTIMERTYSVKGGGRNGYGDYNPSKNLPPGSYKMQFWYGENLLKTIQLTIQ